MSTTPSLPLLIEPDDLTPHLNDPHLLILDVSSRDNYDRHHIPGAIHIPPSQLQCGVKPAVGKLPSLEALTQLFSSLGLTDQHHVVAYDDEGGGWAGRLIWTLDVLGHSRYSYLNGGLVAWVNEKHLTETQENTGTHQNYIATINQTPIAEIEDILPTLGQEHTAIWDARSLEEYQGTKILAKRGGHIPGAVHLDWLDLIDRSNNARLVDLTRLQQTLDSLGLSQDKQIITHCQSHHRSGLSYLAMKILGYPNIKAYHGSWGEWGNQEDTPIDTNH